MLSKDNANTATKAREEKDIQDSINAAIEKMEYQCEVLNLTDYQQSLLKDGGFKLDHTANKNGYLWRINWQ